MSAVQRVVKNTGYLYLKMGITVFFSLWTTRIILNSLGALDFGIYNIVGGAILMLSFLNSTMTSATQRFMNYAEGEGDDFRQKRIFNISIVLHTIVAILFIMVLLIAEYPLFHGILNINPDRVLAAKVVYYSMMLSTVVTIMSIPYNAAINAHENMKFFAFIGVLEAFLKFGIAYATIYCIGDKLILYGILMAIIPFVSAAILCVYCHRHYEECILSPKQYWDKDLFKQMSSFTGWNFLGSTSSLVGNYGIGIVLNHFFGTLLNAAQGVANQINAYLLTFSKTMLRATSPLIAKNEGAGNRKQMILVSLMANKYSYFLLALFAIPAIIEMPFLLSVWLKNVPQWAVVFSRLLLLQSLLAQSVAVFHTSIAAEGRIANYNKIVVVFDLLPIVSTYILFLLGYPPFMMYIMSILFMGFGKGGLKIFYMKKNCGMPFSQFLFQVLTPILTTSLIAALAGVSIVFSFPSGWIRLFEVVCVTTLTFLLAVWGIGMTRRERIELKTILVDLGKKVK